MNIDENGRKRIRYKRYQTPLETLSLLDKGRRKWRYVESPENDSTCFPPFPQTLEIARTAQREMKIMRSDSHIPSVPAASMNQFQIPKGQKPASPTLRFLRAHLWIGKD